MIDTAKVAPGTQLLHPQFEGGGHSGPPYPDSARMTRVSFKGPYTRVHPRTGFEERLASVQFERLGSRMVRPECLFLVEDEAAAWAHLAEMSKARVADLEEQLADWRAHAAAWAAGGPYVEAD